MSNTTRSAQTKSLSLAGLALVAGLAFQPTSALAGQVHHRHFQAAYDAQFQGDNRGEWRKPTGQEIIGGFAGADDLVNARTGEVRSR